MLDDRKVRRPVGLRGLSVCLTAAAAAGRPASLPSRSTCAAAEVIQQPRPLIPIHTVPARFPMWLWARACARAAGEGSSLQVGTGPLRQRNEVVKEERGATDQPAAVAAAKATG